MKCPNPKCKGDLIRFGSRKQVNYKCNTCNSFFSDDKLNWGFLMDNYVPTICIDFDGVLNDYKGWKGENELYEPKEGVYDFLDELKKLGFDLVIHSTRDSDKIVNWLFKNGLEGYFVQITSVKVPAVIYIDDRGLKFNGNFKETLKDVKDFSTYWEQERLKVKS